MRHCFSRPATGPAILRTARTLLLGGALLGSLAACGSKAKTTDPDPTTPDTGANEPAIFAQTGFSTQNGGTTGGASGSTVTVRTLADLQQYASSATPYVIKIEGTITGGTQGASVSVNSNKTLLGVGSTAFLEGVGLTISNKRNVIVRNLKFTMSTVTRTAINDEGRPQVVANDGDCVTIEGSQNLWIDHCEFYNLDPVTQTNQDLYDGLVDAKGSSQYITVSWSYFHDHHKCHLIGSSDSDNADRKMTFHHNYYSNIKERLPSYRGGTAHVFNNYFKHVTGSGVNSRVGACLLVENNVFEDVRDPVTSKNSALGYWSASGNQYLSCTGSQPTNAACTLAVPYATTGVLTPAAEVKDAVTTKAGVGKL
ncbi:pectate lyase family protein [Hymenobacter edaphi]|uniref:pectate lyase n=1 Tax=Hymenobacter edaphi TaxID=2211146 RepID=A0A328BTY7_9BACT|nr:pectate lyase [Hymenobacter edaphi]RAK70597.1 pectate lyase [Hymenobacter edaphi]